MCSKNMHMISHSYIGKGSGHSCNVYILSYIAFCCYQWHRKCLIRLGTSDRHAYEEAQDIEPKCIASVTTFQWGLKINKVNG